MTDHDRGQVDTTAAEVYESVFVPALFSRFAAPIAEAARIGMSDSVLDIACGTGALTREIRERTTGRVVGVDINPGMLAVAIRGGKDIELVEGDASNLAFEDGEFDIAVSQFGMMFLEDPVQGVVEMMRVADRGLVAVWDSIERSTGYAALQDMFRRELGDEAAASIDAFMGMGRDGVLEGVFETAQTPGVEFLSIEGTGHFDSISQWITTEVRGWTLSDSVTDTKLADLVAIAERELSGFVSNDGVTFGVTAKLARWPN